MIPTPNQEGPTPFRTPAPETVLETDRKVSAAPNRFQSIPPIFIVSWWDGRKFAFRDEATLETARSVALAISFLHDRAEIHTMVMGRSSFVESVCREVPQRTRMLDDLERQASATGDERAWALRCGP